MGKTLPPYLVLPWDHRVAGEDSVGSLEGGHLVKRNTLSSPSQPPSFLLYLTSHFLQPGKCQPQGS